MTFLDSSRDASLSFSELDLAPALLAGTVAAGFAHCTPIQAAALPLALAGQDVAGLAQTGTGKTAAFLLALMNRLLIHVPPTGRRLNQPRALILPGFHPYPPCIENGFDCLVRNRDPTGPDAAGRLEHGGILAGTFTIYTDCHHAVPFQAWKQGGCIFINLDAH